MITEIVGYDFQQNYSPGISVPLKYNQARKIAPHILNSTAPWPGVKSGSDKTLTGKAKHGGGFPCF